MKKKFWKFLKHPYVGARERHGSPLGPEIPGQVLWMFKNVNGITISDMRKSELSLYCVIHESLKIHFGQSRRVWRHHVTVLSCCCVSVPSECSMMVAVLLHRHIECNRIVGVWWCLYRNVTPSFHVKKEASPLFANSQNLAASPPKSFANLHIVRGGEGTGVYPLEMGCTPVSFQPISSTGPP